jgi:hypothetical protein
VIVHKHRFTIIATPPFAAAKNGPPSPHSSFVIRHSRENGNLDPRRGRTRRLAHILCNGRTVAKGGGRYEQPL